MYDSERRYYTGRLHDYANFQGVVRGYLLCYKEGVYNANQVMSMLEKAEQEITERLEKLEAYHAEKEGA